MLYVLENNDQQVLVIKSAKDTKGNDEIIKSTTRKKESRYSTPSK